MKQIVLDKHWSFERNQMFNIVKLERKLLKTFALVYCFGYNSMQFIRDA